MGVRVLARSRYKIGRRRGEDQEKKLERQFSQQYQLITRDDRLETIAADVVEHFLGRGHKGKAMIDLHRQGHRCEDVRQSSASLARETREQENQLSKASDEERGRLLALIEEMETTDMAVVVSQSQNEIEDLKKKGVDISPHRRRRAKENLDEIFKDPDSNLRFVFVCAMWITGFDVPSCSTIYLDVSQ